jgi:8-oxo-dGTP pyrophosphatase MutT (NUDIX family)
VKSIEVLKDNEWLTLNLLKYPEKDINGYVYSHEKRCGGKIVSIMPYKKTKDGVEYLLRKEVTPPWHTDKQIISSITGGVEKDDVLETAQHEILEEAGYTVSQKDLVALGTSFGSKSSDTVYYYFTVDVSDLKREIAKGDGSELERKAECVWSKNVDKAEDPLVYVLYYRVNKHLKL